MYDNNVETYKQTVCKKLSYEKINIKNVAVLCIQKHRQSLQRSTVSRSQNV